MNNILKVSLIVIAMLALAGGLFFAGSMFGSFWMQRGFTRFADQAPAGVTNPGGNGNAPVPNNGAGNQGNLSPQGSQPDGQNGDPGNQGGQNNLGPQGGQPDGQNGGPDNQGGPGNQGGRPGGRNGRGGMPGQGGGPGMGGMPGQNRNPANLTPLTVDEAKKAAQDYVTALKIDGLELGEVLIFDTHAYVVVKETATGNGAFELVVDPMNKLAHPEPGPDTLWNLKYGGVLQSGMQDMPGGMGRFGPGPKGPGANDPDANATPNPTPDAAATVAPAATPANVSADMPISQDAALKAAQTYLDTATPGATAATDTLKFYGYYTVKFSKDGKLAGMLSVNGYNGQVLGQPWRGTLIEEPK